MLTVFTVNSAFLEVVVAYSNLALPASRILIRLYTQITGVLPANSTVMMMIVTDTIIGVVLGGNTGATEFMARKGVHEIGGHAVWFRVEWTFTVIRLQLVNNASLQVFTACALATISTIKDKQWHRLDKNSRGVTLLGRGNNILGSPLDNNSRGDTLLGPGSNIWWVRLYKSSRGNTLLEGGRTNLLIFHTSAGNILGRMIIILLDITSVNLLRSHRNIMRLEPWLIESLAGEINTTLFIHGWPSVLDLR
jgi:hypothetical protein